MIAKVVAITTQAVLAGDSQNVTYLSVVVVDSVVVCSIITYTSVVPCRPPESVPCLR
jgi:hypothetical protein